MNINLGTSPSRNSSFRHSIKPSTFSGHNLSSLSDVQQGSKTLKKPSIRQVSFDDRSIQSDKIEVLENSNNHPLEDNQDTYILSSSGAGAIYHSNYPFPIFLSPDDTDAGLGRHFFRVTYGKGTVYLSSREKSIEGSILSSDRDPSVVLQPHQHKTYRQERTAEPIWLDTFLRSQNTSLSTIPEKSKKCLCNIL